MQFSSYSCSQLVYDVIENYPHLTDEKTKAWARLWARPRLQSSRVEELVLSPSTVCLQATLQKSQREWAYDHNNNQHLQWALDYAKEMLKI